ncbi:hypothetical protein TNCV_4015561 [Trichonephila clavipes]|nr:hypothetical protein TNCV_4015561 [Trichonephila clavipes]
MWQFHGILRRKVPLDAITNMRQLMYFVGGQEDGEIQRAVKMDYVQDLKSSLKLEVATQASRREFPPRSQ